MKYLFIISIIFLSFSAFNQSNTISGYIKETQTGEPVIGATVYDSLSMQGTYTNEYGFYSLSLEKNNVFLRYSFTGKKTIQFNFSLKKDTTVNVELSALTLAEVTIIASKNDFSKPDMGHLNISKIGLTKIPTLGSETDMLKSLTIYPGITTGAEGTSNPYIRGGDPGQNLIQLDGVPMYNITHLGGFFSVINSDAIKDVDVYKGGFPARYGNRLSSIIDIHQKEGNNRKLAGNVGLGLLSSQFLLEGPFKKKESSFLLAARTSYIGFFANDFLYWFYDINSKVNFPMGKGKIYISYYGGNDIAKAFTDYTQNKRAGKTMTKDNNKAVWGNNTFSIRYNVPITNKLFAKTLIGFNNYHLRYVEKISTTVDTVTTIKKSKNRNQVNNYLAKLDFDYSLSQKYLIHFGLGLDRNIYKQEYEREKDTLTINNTTQSSDDIYLYIENLIDILPSLSVNAGVQWRGYKTGKDFLSGIEPRFIANYHPNHHISYQTSYTLVNQYVHFISGYNYGNPMNLWIPASKDLRSATAHQFGMGISGKLRNNINFSVEGYFKKLSGMVESKKYEIDYSSKHVSQDIYKNGTGEAYGLEFFIQKNTNKYDISFSYTLSWANRQFDEIFSGTPYPFSYDRRHDITIFTNYDLTDKWSISATWTYMTGRPITVPVGSIPTLYHDIYVARNNERLPAYHRLDIGARHTTITERGKKKIWNFSIYNAYNRRNPSYIAFRSEVIFDDNGQYLYQIPKIVQISLFPIIPSLSYKYQF